MSDDSDRVVGSQGAYVTLPYDDWLAAMHTLTGSPEACQNYLNRRLRFTAAVGAELCASLGSALEVVYGVYL